MAQKHKLSLSSPSRKIYLVIFAVFLIVSQYLLIDFFFMQAINSFFLVCVSFAICVFSLVFFIVGTNPAIAVSVIPFFMGVYISYSAPNSINAFVYYSLFALLVMSGYIISGSKIKEIKKIQGPAALYSVSYTPGLPGLLLFAAVAAALVIIPVILYKMYFPALSELGWYFPVRSLGQGSDGIFGVPFENYAELIYPALFICLVLAFSRMVINERVKKVFFMIAVLFIIAFTGKVVIASLSQFGTAIMPIKTAKAHNAAYYFWALQVENLQDFLMDYVSFYQLYADSSHLKGHPPLPVIIYWIIINFISKEPAVSSAVIGVLSALSVIPVFFITKFVTGSVRASYFGALFYALTPNSLILSVSGIDSVVVPAAASFIALWMWGIRKKSYSLGALSGLAFGIAAYLTFGVWHILLILGIFAVLELFFRQMNNFKGKMIFLLKYSFGFAIGVLSIHLIFFIISAGQFDYIESFRAASKTGLGMTGARPYAIWSWMNFVHWSEYVTAGIISLFLLRYILALAGKIKIDNYSLISLIFVLIQTAACMGRAEQHRMWMYMIAFVVPVSVLPLLYSQGGRVLIKPRYAYIFTFLIYLNTMLIEILITDTH